MQIFSPDSFFALDAAAMITVVLAVLMLLSGLDDLFIDGWYWMRQIRRKSQAPQKYKEVSPDLLRTHPEQAIAIFQPAWHEDDVIATMLENLFATLEYDNYVVFVGTYPNDPATIDEVERVRHRHKRVIRIEVPHPGPTCKADCLNWIAEAFFDFEKRTGQEFAGLVMHDSEDVLHPLELKFFNHLLPRKDFIQIPVTSLERGHAELVAATYMDEFAEWHAKDLVVRERISEMVPSAGVGTLLSRKALLVLASAYGNEPFNTGTLTEDYDIGARLEGRGLVSIFARYDVEYQLSRRTWFGWGKPKQHSLIMPLSVREYFPHRFRDAYRQKARWMIGICLQGWAQIGWPGSFATRYLLFRDRKAVFTPLIGMAAYVVFVFFVGCYLFGGAWFAAWRAQASLFANPLVQTLIGVNALILVWRVGQRAYFVGRIYGVEHAVLSAPRLVVDNFLNFAAVIRAWRLFLAHILFGRRLVWDKTMHEYPSSDAIGIERKRLGELLEQWRIIDEGKLAEALDEQTRTSERLGQVLVSKGWVDENTLADAIAAQADLPRLSPDSEKRSSIPRHRFDKT